MAKHRAVVESLAGDFYVVLAIGFLVLIANLGLVSLKGTRRRATKQAH